MFWENTKHFGKVIAKNWKQEIVIKKPAKSSGTHP